MTTDYFKPSRNLTFATVKAEHAEFIRLLGMNKSNTMHCDLKEVSVCDSAGLAWLMDAWHKCSNQNIQLKINHASKDIEALAKLYGLDRILSDFGDNDE